jgi:hypothetical protein
MSNTCNDAGCAAKLHQGCLGRRQSPRLWSALGPCHNGPVGAQTVASGLEKSQVAGPPAQVARMMQIANSDCGPEGQARFVGQQRAATGHRRDQHEPWRTVTDRRIARALTPSFACGFVMILAGLYPSDVQARRGSLDLTRKGTEVQLLPRLPYPL